VLKLPLSPRKVFSLIGEVQEQSRERARLLLAGVDAETLDAVREALVRDADPDAAGYLVGVERLSKGNGFIPGHKLKSAAGLVMVTSTAEMKSDDFIGRLNYVAASNVPIVLVLTEAPGMAVTFPAAGVGPKHVVGIAPDGKPPADVLAEAVVEAVGDNAVALASGLPALREAACSRLISRTARQNGIIGVLFIIPGADMPVMTLNQLRMLLKMAAAHGEPVGTERALELLSVVAGGLGFRTLARQAVGLLPGPGWAVKGGIGYSGTVAMGRAAKAYFDGEVRVTPSRLAVMAEKVKSLRG
jgi:uncharacterized protein (DUF697 family)